MGILTFSFVVLGWEVYQYYKETRLINIKLKEEPKMPPLIVDNKIVRGSAMCPTCGKKFN